jgi:hypothetical protein
VKPDKVLRAPARPKLAYLGLLFALSVLSAGCLPPALMPPTPTDAPPIAYRARQTTTVTALPGRPATAQAARPLASAPAVSAGKQRPAVTQGVTSEPAPASVRDASKPASPAPPVPVVQTPVPQSSAPQFAIATPPAVRTPTPLAPVSTGSPTATVNQPPATQPAQSTPIARTPVATGTAQRPATPVQVNTTGTVTSQTRTPTRAPATVTPDGYPQPPGPQPPPVPTQSSYP